MVQHPSAQDRGLSSDTDCVAFASTNAGHTELMSVTRINATGGSDLTVMQKQRLMFTLFFA